MPFKVVIDACVVYPSTVRDILLTTAHQGLYQLAWSDQILDEAFRNLLIDGRMTPEQVAKTSSAMQRAFPEAKVVGYDHLVPAMRNDPKDRHVVAVAVKAGAQVIVTANIPDFQELPSGIEAQTPDTFLCNLFDLAPDRVIDALGHIVSRHKKYPTTLLRLAAAVGPEFAETVAAYTSAG